MSKSDDEDLGFTPDPHHDDAELGFVAESPRSKMTDDTSTIGTVLRGTGKGLAGVAKALDILRGTTTGPALGSVLEKITGKPVYSGQDVANAVNPTNLQKFPSASEMYERAGVPEGAKVSDYLSMYADPNKAHPWYQPEKDGLLDWTLRGTGGTATDIAIDPVTWLTMGAGGAAKKALASDATAQALEAAAKGASPGAKLLEMVSSSAPKGIEMGPVEKAGQALVQTPVVGTAATPATSLLKKWGKGLYDSFLQPVENQGLKSGKKDVGDVLYKAGVISPIDLPSKAQVATSALMDARNAIAKEATEKGAQVSMRCNRFEKRSLSFVRQVIPTLRPLPMHLKKK